MGIGLLALYAALAVVALWLVAELLLQNRAPLHWRGTVLGGFLLVVAGMAVKSVPLIGVGAATFAVGQVFVTLSLKRGYAAGWSLRAADGSLPGPLARIPLLSAATGGAAVVAVAAAVPLVGEVGPIEVPEQELLPEPAVEEPAAEDYGIYDAVYQEQQQPYVPYEQQQWQQQPEYGYQEYQQQQPYQDPYWDQQQQQQQYQQYGIPQQQGYEYYQQPEHQPQPEAWQQ